jgi:ribonuclease VapC
LLDAAEVLVAPADVELVQTAFAAWQRFGKRQHPAGLNFGDRFAYALAMRRGVALLFKGQDFSQTDVPQA